MKFGVGQRVKVVKDEIDPRNVGLLGTVSSLALYDPEHPYNVSLDNGRVEIFREDDLEAVSVTTIEGVVDYKADMNSRWVDVGDTDVIKTFKALNGKRVKLTLEVCE
jgi:hypothetical protein